MKKIIFALLIGVFIIFGAFSQGSSETGTSKACTKLVYQHGFDPATSADGVAHAEKEKEYEMETGIAIQSNIMEYGPSREKMIISGQAKEGPDCIHMLAENVPEYVSMGIIQDITADMKNWSDFDKFPQSAWDVATIDGKIYGIPSCASTRVLVYRDDLLKEAGCEVPKTWDELRTVAKKLTKDNDGDGIIDVYGLALATSSDISRGPQEFGVFLYSVDQGEFAKYENDRWIPGFSVEQAEKVFQLYYDLMFVDKSIPPYSIGWGWQELDPSFATGTVAMVQNGAWLIQRADGGNNSDHWYTSSFPYYSNPSTYMEVKVEGVGAFTKCKEEAVDMLKWMYSRDNLVIMSQTDNLPSRSDSIESPYWVPNKMWKDNFIDEVYSGFSYPSISISTILQSSMDNTQAVLYEVKTPHQAAVDFYKTAKKYLDEEIND